MIFFKYLKSYFNYSTNGRASINEYIRLSVIDLVLFVFLLFAAISERLGQWPTAIIFGSLVWHHHAVTRRRQHDFYNQRPISNFDNPRSNPIEIFIDFISLFSLDSDEGENEYDPEPWDSKKMKSKTALSVICCLLTVLCLCLTACQTSSITVIDAETREPVADAMVFAYCHDFVAFPRQRLYTTDDKGEITFVYQSGDSFWIGKPGYYPYNFPTYFNRLHDHGFLFWFTFPPATIPLHPVKTGKRAEVKKARNAYGIIFYHRNPPRESVLLKILQYSHWVYMNTAFYEDNARRDILEEFFKKYSFPVKPEQSR